MSAGSDVIVFAQLTVSVPEAAAPGATRATPIGTASNLVALNILNKPRKRLSFATFAKRSIPLTIIDLAIANAILLLRL